MAKPSTHRPLRAGSDYTNNPVDVTSIKKLKQIFLSQKEPIL